NEFRVRNAVPGPGRISALAPLFPAAMKNRALLPIQIHAAHAASGPTAAWAALPKLFHSGQPVFGAGGHPSRWQSAGLWRRHRPENGAAPWDYFPETPKAPLFHE